MKDAAVYLAAVILCLHLTLPRVCKTFILYLFFSDSTLSLLHELDSASTSATSHAASSAFILYSRHHSTVTLALDIHPRYSPPPTHTHINANTPHTHTLAPLLSPPVSTSNRQCTTNTCPDAAFPSAEIQLKPHQRVLEVRRHWGELLKRFTQVPVKPQDARYAYEPKMVLRRNVFFSKRDEVKIRWVGRGEVGRMNWWAGNGGV